MSSTIETDQDESYWVRNLFVCLFGSFTTFLAMTLMLPFLPIYVQQLGVKDHASIAQWSGIAYSATFFIAGMIAPFWGYLGDRYGRKPMLLRASLGMAVTMALMGCATNIWQLVGLRLLAGFAGGYSSGATIMIAAQTPKDRSAWALGLLSSGIMAGNLIGPLIGGILPSLIGIRITFIGAGCLIFITFLVTLGFIRESSRLVIHEKTVKGNWFDIPNKRLIFIMLVTGMLLMIANMSIEPIITLYVHQLAVEQSRITFFAGLIMSAGAFGSILSASWLGHLADKIGHARIIIWTLIIAGILLVPQAYVTSVWQLIVLRFFMGLALGGLMPCIITIIRHQVPNHLVGTVLGYTISVQYVGQVIGPLAGGFVSGYMGMYFVFLATSVLLLIGAIGNWFALKILDYKY